MVSHIKRLANLGFVTLILVNSVFAASDPTRPPDAWLSQQVSAANSDDSGAPRLQSVLIPQKGQPVAVISGRTVKLGSRFRELVLVQLSEQEAILRGPEGVTRLYLTPDVNKRMIAAPAINKELQTVQGKERR
jgi:MSHA biogenesis protein MshK